VFPSSTLSRLYPQYHIPATTHMNATTPNLINPPPVTGGSAGFLGPRRRKEAIESARLVRAQCVPQPNWTTGEYLNQRVSYGQSRQHWWLTNQYPCYTAPMWDMFDSDPGDDEGNQEDDTVYPHRGAAAPRMPRRLLVRICKDELEAAKTNGLSKNQVANNLYQKVYHRHRASQQWSSWSTQYGVYSCAPGTCISSI
jgi:hypothetical protein